MSKTETALKLALEALEVATTPLAKDRQEVLRARAAIREALAQPEQEPVAVVTGTYGGRFTVKPVNPAMVLPLNMALYTTPPQRKPLTDEEIEKIWWETKPYFDKHDFTRAIEQAHGIKE